MDLDTIPEVYTKQDLRFNIECKEADGTAFNLSAGGVAEFQMWRDGLHPFTISLSTLTDPGAATITNAAGGLVTFMVPAMDMNLWPGLCRYQVRATAGDGHTEVQIRTWMRLLEAV
jgi:hypothetical protein